jgi:uncharacterized protein (TIGR03437 family)
LVSSVPIAIALDRFGNVVAAEAVNRVAAYFPTAGLTHGANFATATNNYALAPGMIATVFGGYGGAEASAASVPLPTMLNNLRTFVDDRPAPLFYAGPGQVNFQIPKDTAISTTRSSVVVVEQTDSERPLSVSSMRVSNTAPGVFQNGAVNAQNQVRAVVLNQDSTVNSAENPARVGDVIQIYSTGLGIVPNHPADGTPASGAAPMAVPPRAFIDRREMTIEYAGLAPGLVGLWQVNARIPTGAVPANGQNSGAIFELILRAEGRLSSDTGQPTVRNAFIYIRR